MSRVALLTIAFNAEEWLEKLFLQHKDWPCDELIWVFVESCDRMYAQANPGCATEHGLSTDGTTTLIRSFQESDPHIRYIGLGFVEHQDPALGKIACKQRALAEVEDDRPDYFVILDSDEFYIRDDQRRLIEYMDSQPERHAFIFAKREIWRPPVYREQSLFSYEVVGGFWDIPCCHTYRWSPGVQFRDCHNSPQFADGRYLSNYTCDFRDVHSIFRYVSVGNPGRRMPVGEPPQMIHLGYASSRESRRAKHNYYFTRGEATDRERRWYVESRASWFSWRLRGTLPHGAKVVPYTGPIPECFKELPQ